MVNVRDLDKFLKEREGEWWTPYEIKNELGSDIRTVKNVIRRLSRRPWETTYKGWRLDVAERGKRLYVVRMVRNIEGSENLIKAEISEVERIPVDSLENIFNNQDLILKNINTIVSRDAFLSYLERAKHHDKSKIRLRNLEKLKGVIQDIKEDRLKELNEYLNGLGASP